MHCLSKQFRVHCKISQLCLCKIPVYPLTGSQLCCANAAEMVCVRSSCLLLWFSKEIFERRSDICTFYIRGLKFSQSTKCVIIDVAHHLKRFHCQSSPGAAVSVHVLRCDLRVVLTPLSKRETRRSRSVCLTSEQRS